MILKILKKIIPYKIYLFFAPLYHRLWAWLSAIRYGFPSKELKIVAVTGTKGKSSVGEFINNILEQAGQKTALANTIRFKIADHSEPNKLKMTMPGRFFIQKFLRTAVKNKCNWAVIEMTSEGAKQFRHLGISMDALVFTNIAPEHIESHGSMENYVKAKLSIGEALVKSKKRPRIIIANADDEYGSNFLNLSVDESIPYSLTYAEPWETDESGTDITFDDIRIHSPIPGEFTIYNMLAAGVFAKALGITTNDIRIGLENTKIIKGRVERVEEGQDFEVIVDYAHTTESLEKLYQAFPNRRKICVLGNTGGGRDTWKRPKMAALAEKYCEHIILTDEDPYDEDPKKIIKEMADGMKTPPSIILDRRNAIKSALSIAKKLENSIVLITGKGTDPYIMRENGKREVWSDTTVTREELRKIIS